MKRVLIAGAVLIPLAAYAALKTWTSGETLKAADLNRNFAELSTVVNTAASAVSAPITDARVASSAAINHSKLAVPALVPKAWASTMSASSTCSTGPTCTFKKASGIKTTFTRVGTGNYAVEFTAPRPNADYAAVASSNLSGNICTPSLPTTAGFTVKCADLLSAATIDTFFTVLVMDDDN